MIVLDFIEWRIFNTFNGSL